MADNVYVMNKDAKAKKESASKQLESFLVKNRALILSVLCVCIVVLVTICVVVGVSSSQTKKSLASIDSIEYSYTKNAPSLSGDELVTLQNETLASLQPYLSKKKIVGVQANKLAAEIAYEKEDYNASIQYYLAQAHADENSYTAAVAYFMVASSYEELSNFEEAEKYYGLASEQSDFLLVPHALFNLARVKESRGDKDGAVLVYKQMVSDYPNDDWTNLAQSRLISLNASGIVE